MQTILRTLILVLTLAIPALIFVFLKSFGTNKFDLDVYFASGVESNMWNCNFVQGKQHYIPSFEFKDQTGKLITDDVLTDGITVVDFFFTSCPSICPVMTNELARVQEAFNGNSKVKIISFTVDPENDSVDKLAEYADEKGADPSIWHFITGEKKELYRIARCGFILPVDDGDGGPEDFIHSPKFVLVDGQKRIRGYYEGTEREDVDRLITEIKILLSNI
jgi:protein SCO1